MTRGTLMMEMMIGTRTWCAEAEREKNRQTLDIINITVTSDFATNLEFDNSKEKGNLLPA